MMIDSSDVLIIGGGLAASTAASALREFGFQGTITLTTEEDLPPYDRPPLSKEALLGEKQADAIQLLSAETCAAKGIRLLLGARGEAIDTEARTVDFAGGRRIRYSRLILATGARLRRLPVSGSELDNVFYLRTYSDCVRLRSVLTEGNRLVIIGGGFIGLEVATAAIRSGCQVTVVEASPRLMMRAVPAPIGSYFRALHEKQGVELHLQVSVRELVGGQRVEGVVLADGKRIPADAVLVGIGVEADSALAARAGLAVDDGILVNWEARTSSPEVYACGDACRMESSFYGRAIRTETWQSAIETARAAAGSICERPVESTGIPWFWSDQAGVNFQMVGIDKDGDDFVVRGSVDSGKFTAFLMRNSIPIAAYAVNNGRDIRSAKHLIAARHRLDREQLVDSSLDLRKLTSAIKQAAP